MEDYFSYTAKLFNPDEADRKPEALKGIRVLDFSHVIFGPIAARLLALSLIHISEPTRLLSISYAVFCLKKKKNKQKITEPTSSYIQLRPKMTT